MNALLPKGRPENGYYKIHSLDNQSLNVSRYYIVSPRLVFLSGVNCITLNVPSEAAVARAPADRGQNTGPGRSHQSAQSVSLL